MIIANLTLLSLTNFRIPSLPSATTNRLRLSGTSFTGLLRESVHLHRDTETDILSITQFKGFPNEKDRLYHTYKVVVVLFVVVDAVCLALFAFVFNKARKSDKKDDDSVMHIPVFANDI